MRDMIQGVNDIVKLEDPIGKVLLKRELDEGLILTKTSCPIGVLGIIFEARPDVITQVSALAIKSSNAVILKGGKESKNTNKMREGIIISQPDILRFTLAQNLRRAKVFSSIAIALPCSLIISLSEYGICILPFPDKISL